MIPAAAVKTIETWRLGFVATVSAGGTGHAEAVRLFFDEGGVSYELLLEALRSGSELLQPGEAAAPIILAAARHLGRDRGVVRPADADVHAVFLFVRIISFAHLLPHQSIVRTEPVLSSIFWVYSKSMKHLLAIMSFTPAS